MSRFGGIQRLVFAAALGGCGLSSQAQIQVINPNPVVIAVDKNGAGAVSLTLKNTSTLALPLQLSIADFAHQEAGKSAYPLNSLPVLTPASDADKAKITPQKLTANDSV